MPHYKRREHLAQGRRSPVASSSRASNLGVTSSRLAPLKSSSRAPLSQLRPAQMSPASRIWMLVLRGCLVLAGGLVLVRIIILAVTGRLRRSLRGGPPHVEPSCQTSCYGCHRSSVARRISNPAHNLLLTLRFWQEPSFL
jgi:hypothetical protein